MEYSAVIIDDEPHGAEALELLVAEYCPELEIKAVAHTVQDAVAAIMLHKPAMVFLDVEMPTGSGFEVIERTAHMQYKVIFTTAYEEYALQAIKANAIEYLLKPVIAEELMKAVNKATAGNGVRITELLAMAEQLTARTSGSVSKIPVPCSEGLIFIEPGDILHLEADSNYTHFFIAGGKKITASKTMKDIEKMLPDTFTRVHTTHIVNTQKIEKYIKGDGGYVVLENGTTVPVSRSQKQAFLNRIGKN